MFNSDDFLSIFKFLSDNQKTSDLKLGELVYNDEAKNISELTTQYAIENRLATEKFFKNVIDIPPFENTDYSKIRNLIVDWYSSLKTLGHIQRVSTDPHSLDSTILDLAIKSFGFNTSHDIKKRQTKSFFLTSLINLYKKKGTPSAMISALSFFGFKNIKLYEWWLTRIKNDIMFEGRRIDTDSDDTSPSESKKIVRVGYDFFINKVKDSHWIYTEAQILQLSDNSEIGLPSISPFFTVEATADLSETTKAYLSISRLVDEQFSKITSGSGKRENDILVDTTGIQRDIYIDGYQDNVSLIELYLGILHAYHSYNDYTKYKKLRDYILLEFTINPENDESFSPSSPFTYESLLFWAYNRKNSSGNLEMLDIKATGSSSGNRIQPLSGKRFELIESDSTDKFYNDIDISGGIVPTSDLDFDSTVYNFDENIFPILTRMKVYRDNLKYYTYIQSYKNDSSGDVSLPHTKENLFEELFDNNTSLKDPEWEVLLEKSIDAFRNQIANQPLESNISNRRLTRDEANFKLAELYDMFTKKKSDSFIQNKFDPIRILSGRSPVQSVSSLPTTGNSLNDTILVIGETEQTTLVYKWDGNNWNIVVNGTKSEYLGINQKFVDYIESIVTNDKEKYIDVVEDLLRELDVVVSSFLKSTPVDLIQFLLGIPLTKVILPVIEFFKPKRARFVEYDLVYALNYPLMDSFYFEDKIEISDIDMNIGPDQIRYRTNQNQLRDYDLDKVYDPTNPQADSDGYVLHPEFLIPGWEYDSDIKSIGYHDTNHIYDRFTVEIITPIIFEETITFTETFDEWWVLVETLTFTETFDEWVFLYNGTFDEWWVLVGTLTYNETFDGWNDIPQNIDYIETFDEWWVLEGTLTYNETFDEWWVLEGTQTYNETFDSGY